MTRKLTQITDTDIQNKILEILHIPIFAIIENVIVGANQPAAELILSKSQDQILGRKIDDFFETEEIREKLQALNDTDENVVDLTLKLRQGVPPEGVLRFIAFSVDYNGSPAVILLGKDLSSHSEWIFEFLGRSNHIFEILKELPHPIFLLDREGKICRYSPGATIISEIFSTIITGENIFELVPPEIAEKVKTIIEKTVESNLPQRVECKLALENKIFIISCLSLPIQKNLILLVIFDRTHTVITEQDLSRLSELYRTVTTIALEFISCDLSIIHMKINDALEQVGKAVQVDRVYIFDYDFEKEIMKNTYEWCAPGIESQIDNLQEVPNSAIPDWVNAHLNRKEIIIENVGGLPENDNLRLILEPQGIQSLVTVPIFLQDKLIGFVGFDSVVQHRIFTPEEIQLLKVFAELLGAVSARARMEGELLQKTIELERSQTAMLSLVEDLQQEIERRKETEKALEISERNYRDIFISVTEAIFVLDINSGRIIDVNDAAVKMYGYDNKEDLLSVDPSSLRGDLEPYTQANFRKLFHDVVEGQIKTSEWPARRKNGELFWIELTMKKIFLVDEEVILVVKRDITDRRQVEMLLKLQYNIANAMVRAASLDEFLKSVRIELSSVMDTSNFFIAQYDRSRDTLRQIIWIDEKDEFNEWKAENSLSGIVVKSNKPLLLRKSDIKDIEKSHPAQLLGSDPECWLGVPIVVKDEVFGAMVVQNYANQNAYDKHSQEILQTIANQIGVYIEKKLAEKSLLEAKEKAEESDRLKTAFLQNISHEIRTPLNGIIGFAELLSEKDVTKKEVTEYADIILTSAHRLLNLINNIIDISKIQSGILEAKYTSINLNKTINKIIKQFSILAGEKQLKIKSNYSLPDEDSIIFSDEFFIQQIISNLLSNAIKFTDKGEIEVSYILQGNKLLFSIRDTGCGIAPEQKEKIFERFYQADLSLTRKYEGAGLGLAITKGLVEALGGKIWFESVPHQGTTFYFTIPYYLSKTVTDTVKIETEKKVSAKKKKILVVEDERINYLYISRILDTENFEVIPAFTGEKAIEIVKNDKDIDLVLMDIKLPDLSGIEVTKTIKQIRPALPVIAQSAYAFTNEREKMMEAGCDDYISKPFLKQDFLKIINKFLS